MAKTKDKRPRSIRGAARSTVPRGAASGTTASAASDASEENKFPFPESTDVPAPATRPLKAYAFDPSLGRFVGNEMTIEVKYEKLLISQRNRFAGRKCRPTGYRLLTNWSSAIPMV